MQRGIQSFYLYLFHRQQDKVIDNTVTDNRNLNRIKATKYAGEIPSLLIDPFNYEIMSHPIKLLGEESMTLDKLQYEKYILAQKNKWREDNRVLWERAVAPKYRTEASFNHWLSARPYCLINPFSNVPLPAGASTPDNNTRNNLIENFITALKNIASVHTKFSNALLIVSNSLKLHFCKNQKFLCSPLINIFSASSLLELLKDESLVTSYLNKLGFDTGITAADNELGKFEIASVYQLYTAVINDLSLLPELGRAINHFIFTTENIINKGNGLILAAEIEAEKNEILDDFYQFIQILQALQNKEFIINLMGKFNELANVQIIKSPHPASESFDGFKDRIIHEAKARSEFIIRLQAFYQFILHGVDYTFQGNDKELQDVITAIKTTLHLQVNSQRKMDIDAFLNSYNDINKMKQVLIKIEADSTQSIREIDEKLTKVSHSEKDYSSFVKTLGLSRKDISFDELVAYYKDQRVIQIDRVVQYKRMLIDKIEHVIKLADSIIEIENLVDAKGYLDIPIKQHLFNDLLELLFSLLPEEAKQVPRTHSMNSTPPVNMRLMNAHNLWLHLPTLQLKDLSFFKNKPLLLKYHPELSPSYRVNS